MKLKLSFALLSILLFQSAELSSWGLLQGRTRSQIINERNQFYAGRYRVFDPFYAGPLLAPSAYTIPHKMLNVQPYFFWTRNYGIYDRTWHRVKTRSSLQFKFLSVFQYGLTEFMQCTATISSALNRKEKQRHFGYGDTSTSVGFQLTQAIMGTPMPASLLQIGMIFPSGRHDKLVVRKLGVDATGAGAYGTFFSLNFQKSFNSIFIRDLDPRSYHPFRFRWSFGYTINSRTHVEGPNAYGGGPGTSGTVKVGNNFTSIFSLEFSFNAHWVLATDLQYTANGPSKFSGNNAGFACGTPGNQNWSIAPALEYNFNGRLGALVGAWFSLTGRNSTGFVTGIASVTYLF